jgi:predicted esterase
VDTLTSKSLDNIPYWECGQVEASTPITLVLHWMGGDAAAIQKVLFDKFDTSLRLIFLEGQYPSGDELGGYSWYPAEVAFYQRSEAEQAPDIRRQADRIADFLTQLKAVYPVKTAVIGMSQGGDLTLAMAAYYP